MAGAVLMQKLMYMWLAFCPHWCFQKKEGKYELISGVLQWGKENPENIFQKYL